MLSPHLAQEIRNDERLSFMHAVERVSVDLKPECGARLTYR